jgi:hypothetical protein
MQTEKGKYNVHNRNTFTPKRIAEYSESEESLEEETCRPTKKCLKVTEGFNSKEVDCHASSVKNVVKVISSNGSESDFQVSIQYSLLCKKLLMSNLLIKDNSVEDQHNLAILAKFNCKKDMAWDVHLFSDRIKVKFIKGSTTKTLDGQWCTICR